MKATGVGAYLCTIALNEVRQQAKKKKTEQRALRHVALQNTSNEENDPLEATVRTEDKKRLKAELLKLPGQELKAILLRFYPPQRTYDEIAKELSVSSSTAHNLVCRGVDHLRKML
jgi:RNA polymerase sigma factor (sigma-70 family)